MPEPKNLNSTTSSTLPQLLDIDSQLSFQEAQLLSQLESIQQKRQSLQVVISLFNETDKAHVAAPTEEEISTPLSQTEKPPQSVDERQAEVELESQESLTTSTPIPATVKKTATSTKKKGQTRKSQSRKKTKPVVGWQQYLREEFRNSSLPQAIAQVLHSDEKRVWDTATVADAIFVEEISQEVKKKVRLQITNLLAQGVRENKWHREQQGFYTLSGKA